MPPAATVSPRTRGTRRPLELDQPFEEVLAGARSGAPGATRHLYEALAGRVCGYLRAQGAVDPEGLTNEVFLRVFGHLVDFVGGEAQFRAWVFSIAHHIVVDDRRRRSVRPQTNSLGAAVAESVVGGDTEEEAIIQLDCHEITRLLETLTPEQRDVITLRVLGDLSIDDVARAMSRRPGSIKALQRRGLTALRHRLRDAS